MLWWNDALFPVVYCIELRDVQEVVMLSQCTGCEMPRARMPFDIRAIMVGNRPQVRLASRCGAVNTDVERQQYGANEPIRLDRLSADTETSMKLSRDSEHRAKSRHRGVICVSQSTVLDMYRACASHRLSEHQYE